MSEISDIYQLHQQERSGERQIEQSGVTEQKIAPNSLTHIQELFTQGLDVLLQKIEAGTQDEETQALIREQGSLLSRSLDWLTQRLKDKESDTVPTLSFLLTASKRNQESLEELSALKIIGEDVGDAKLRLEAENEVISFLSTYQRYVQSAISQQTSVEPAILLLDVLKLFTRT